MPKLKVTQKAVEALLARPHQERVDYHDTLRPGLTLRVGPRGAVWYFTRRIDGRLVRVKLDRWPRMGIKAAAAKVGELETAIAEGKHPAAVRARERADQQQARTLDQARLVEQVAEAWERHHVARKAPSTAASYRQHLKRFVYAYQGRDIGTLSRGELVRHLDEVRNRCSAGVAANHAATVIRQLFSFAADRLDLESNPAIGLKNPVKTRPRGRVLDRSEIRTLWTACSRAGYPYGSALRMALCTGQRIGEVGAMRHDQLRDGYWIQADNKSGQRIDIYLATLARQVLAECPEFGGGPFVFSASGGLRGIRSDTWWNAMRRHIDPALAAVAEDPGLKPIQEHWTAHDLRRTVRTALTGWCQVSPDTAERVLNHTIGGLRAHYDFADYRPHVTAALKAWDTELARILGGEAAQVIALRGGG